MNVLQIHIVSMARNIKENQSRIWKFCYSQLNCILDAIRELSYQKKCSLQQWTSIISSTQRYRRRTFCDDVSACSRNQMEFHWALAVLSFHTRIPNTGLNQWQKYLILSNLNPFWKIAILVDKLKKIFFLKKYFLFCNSPQTIIT